MNNFEPVDVTLEGLLWAADDFKRLSIILEYCTIGRNSLRILLTGIRTMRCYWVYLLKAD